MTNLTIEEIELRKYEAKISLINKGILGLVGTVTTAILAGIFSIYTANQESNNRLQLEQLKTTRELDLKTYEVELKLLEKYSDIILESDLDSKMRISQYLSLILITPQIRKGWADYSKVMEHEIEENKKERSELERKIENPSPSEIVRKKDLEKRIKEIENIK